MQCRKLTPTEVMELWGQIDVCADEISRNLFNSAEFYNIMATLGRLQKKLIRQEIVIRQEKAGDDNYET